MAVVRKMVPVPWQMVRIGGGFWGRRLAVNRRVTLPLAYEQNRTSGALDAYQWTWDQADPSNNRSWRIWVGDVGKWIEAASYSLATHPDPALEERIASTVRRMVAGQKSDGYLSPNPFPPHWQWEGLEYWHELYELGHDIEGAVARFQATGNRDLLDAVCRYADRLIEVFGRDPGQKRGYDGHPEIELALAKLYRVTGEERYLRLAAYFVNERGQKPNYFEQERQSAKALGMPTIPWMPEAGLEYHQSHEPARSQSVAVGHAVRALYFYSGMADVAAETGDAALLSACRRLWKSVTRRRMYITGGVGSTKIGEKFTFDYDLPNETGYGETCAAIALVFFAHRMLQIEADGQYADVMERALYNGALSGVGLAGDTFFYSNRLTVFPPPRGEKDENVATARRKWFGCACCPPNIARLLASLGGYAYSVSRNTLWTHLYLNSEVSISLDTTPAKAKSTIRLAQRTRYPWDPTVRLTITKGAGNFALMLRSPGWCRKASATINGKPMRLGSPIRGYWKIRREWMEKDAIELRFEMPIERIEAHPDVRMDCGKTALMRGPIVYCMEEIDNGKNLADITLRAKPGGEEIVFDRGLGGAAVLLAPASRRQPAGWSDQLYRPASSKRKPIKIRAVPYCFWGNRRPGEMIVWMHANASTT